MCEHVYVCVPTSPHERPQPHVRVCLSHLSFHSYTYSQHFTAHTFSIRSSSSVLLREIHNLQSFYFHFIFASPPACVYFYFLFWFWVSFAFIFERNFTMKITTQKALKGNRNWNTFEYFHITNYFIEVLVINLATILFFDPMYSPN